MDGSFLQIPVATWLDQVESSGIEIIRVSRAIAARVVLLPEHHKDPVDRIIIATALENTAGLASIDARFPDYDELEELLVK